MSALTRTERDALSDLRDEIALSIRGSPDLDGPDVAELAYLQCLRHESTSCSCGRSDGEECHCRGDPPGPD